MPYFPVKRADLADGDCLCNHCTALCCRYFSLPIQTPETWADFDTLKWYVRHGQVTLFVESSTWYLVVFGACKYLTAENRCGIYYHRPLICGQYTTDGCEYDNDFVFEQYFEHPDQLEEYAEAVLPPRRKPDFERPLTFTVPVDAPENWDDFDIFRWYMTHGRIGIILDQGKWYLLVLGEGETLTPELLQRMPHRSQVRSRASKVSLRPAPEFVSRYFQTPEQVWEYAEALLPPREPLARNRPQSVELPLVDAI